MNVEGCASRLTRSLLHHYNVARKSTTFADRKVMAGRWCSFRTTNGCEGAHAREAFWFAEKSSFDD
jgi:hypothetical protein